MPKFIYKMENILGIKYKMEEQAKIAYGNARIKLMEEEEKLFSLNKKLVSYQLKLKGLMSDNLNIIKINHCREGIEVIKSAITKQQLQVKKAEQLVEARRTSLNTCILERKTHEKLKEKAFDSFILDYEGKQRIEIDELVSFKYNSPTVN